MRRRAGAVRHPARDFVRAGARHLRRPCAAPAAILESALIPLAGIPDGSKQGGRSSSILLDLPGDAGAVTTTLDGHPMAARTRSRARASRALRQSRAMVSPPSTAITAPVENASSPRASGSTAAPTSAGAPQRPAGTRPAPIRAL